MGEVIEQLATVPPWLVLGLVFLLPALEASAFVGLFVPAEIVVVLGGLAAYLGTVPLWGVCTAAAVGAALGDQLGFTLGRRRGPALLHQVSARTHRPVELRKATALVRRRGWLAVLVGRWALALRALVPGVAGGAGMSQGRFTPANIFGGTTWAIAMAVLGYYAGAAYEIVNDRLGIAGDMISAIVVIAVVVLVIARRQRTHQDRSVI